MRALSGTGIPIFAVPSSEAVTQPHLLKTLQRMPTDNVCVHYTLLALLVFVMPSSEVVSTVAPAAENTAENANHSCSDNACVQSC